MTERQKFCASFARDAKFAGGLRGFLEYRDLGIAEASNGKVRAHVIRVRKDEGAGALHTTGLHRHHLDFQMFYVLRGWIRFVYEEHGEYTFGPGDCCMQPAGIVHNELDCSDDLELLEITSPASFETEVLGEAAD